MSANSATIRDVARLAKVSPATVSNVLGGTRSVRETSREAVLKAVAALNYQADPAAAYLRTGRSRVVAAVVPSLENPFFTAFVAAVERLCQRDGYEVLVASSESRTDIEAARIRALMQWRPAAFFLVPVGGAPNALGELARAAIPFAIADRRVVGETHDFVEIDNVAAGELAARHLVDLGHRRLAVIAPSFDVANIRGRVEGVRTVLAEFAAPEPVLVELGEETTDGSVRGRHARIPPETTAAVALTNFTTLQAIGMLARERRSIPGDISLLGFDDYSWMSVASPSISAIRQPIAQMADAVWKRLLVRIETGTPAGFHAKLDAELVVRESTAKPPREAVTHRDPS